jgi:hypothetical protein
VDLRRDVAEEIVRDVLEWADDEYRVSGQIAQPYDRPETRAVLTEQLARQLAWDLVKHRLLPTALHREVITRPQRNLAWENTKVELVVPVRRAP